MPRKKKTEESSVSDLENEPLNNISVYVDTRSLMPGMIVYTVVPTPPTNKVPYAVYHIEPRIITQIHDSGVNGGTIFITYTHYVSSAMGNNEQIQIKSQEETLYSPLTKEHAEYVAKKLNEQSKALYLKCCEQNQQTR